jgi:hypothetical protein
LGNSTALVILNFKAEKVGFSLGDEQDWEAFRFVLGNYYYPLAAEYQVPMISGNDLLLQGFEGRLYIRS